MPGRAASHATAPSSTPGPRTCAQRRLADLVSRARSRPLTILYAARGQAHNNAIGENLRIASVLDQSLNTGEYGRMTSSSARRIVTTSVHLEGAVLAGRRAADQALALK
jgi:hypothetical protein